MNTYEVMFLFDPVVGANWEAVEAEIDRLMSRSDAAVIITKRLEERKLAFEIKGRKRGLYVLTYFRADGDRISGLERDIRLSELALRALILRADSLSEQQMREATLGGAVPDKPPHKSDDHHKSGVTADSLEGSPAERPIVEQDEGKEELITSGEETKSEV